MPWSDDLDKKMAEFIRSSEELKAVDDEGKDVYAYIAESLGLERQNDCSPRAQAKEAVLKLSGFAPNAEYYVTSFVVRQVRSRFFNIGGQE